MASKNFKVTIIFVMLGLLSSVAFAWGPEGHQVVAQLATERLTPAAKAQVKALLGTQTLVSVANYADQIRNQRPETSNWHFVDIPLDQNTYDATRDCAATPKGDCVIAELARASADVVNTKLAKAQRAEALKFIVHFVGDMHQPLHCTDNNDRGGNSVDVTWFGKPSNLHRVWDSDIITESHLTEQAYADQLDSWLDSQDEKAMAAGTPIDWAEEAHKQAQQHTYVGVSNGSSLGSDYFDANESVVDEQLARGGVRLAKVLNTLFVAAKKPAAPASGKKK